MDIFNVEFASILIILEPIVSALLVAFVIGWLIHYVYQKSFRGVVYNQAFSVSLAVLTILTTLVTLAISSNIALSLGMVGALSIVRYRTAIKDPADIIFLFWAVASGITIGAKIPYLAVAGALMVILMLVTLGRKSASGEMFILIIHYTGDDIGNKIKQVLQGERFVIKSKTIRNHGVEVAIEIQVKDNNISFMETIKDMPSVTDVSLIQFSGE